MTNVTVLGAGAWGTAFGQVLADAGNNVTMWAIEPEIVEGIRDHHHNGVRLPSVKVLPSNMTATGDRAEAVANADIVIVAIAAQFARVALVEFKDLIPETALVASLMKGIERTTGKRMDEVVMETLDLPADRFAAISGPNLSKQIADREPAATVVACENLDNARKIAAACTNDYFRAFVTRDVIGLEMCGSLKNVVALAVGMARGAGYGENTAAMIGLAILAVILLVAIFAGVICDYDTQVIAQNMAQRLQPPSAEHWFGTDAYGRDTFARVVYGARISLAIGVAATVGSVLISGF